MTAAMAESLGGEIAAIFAASASSFAAARRSTDHGMLPDQGELLRLEDEHGLIPPFSSDRRDVGV
jgi:hypothetical protein